MKWADIDGIGFINVEAIDAVVAHKATGGGTEVRLRGGLVLYTSVPYETVREQLKALLAPTTV